MSRSRNGLKPEHVLIHVVRPTIEALDMDGLSAEQLLMGTVAQESNFRFLSQLAHPVTGRRGPALGIFQMEPATHDDIWRNYLYHRTGLASTVAWVAGTFDEYAPMQQLQPEADTLTWNLRYACAMARLHYRRVPDALPPAGDEEAMARYWKRWYNTPAGAGTEEEFLANWHRFGLSALWA